MLPLVLAELAAAPVQFDTLVRDAEIIGVATVIRSDFGANTSTLEFDQLFRGSAETLDVSRAFSAGERGVFFSGPKIEPAWLSFQPQGPGFAHAERGLELPSRFRSPTAEPESRIERISSAQLLKELGVEKQKINPRPEGFRVITRTCKPCAFPAAASALIAPLQSPIRCEKTNVEACVNRAWKQKQPVIAMQQVPGIDSEITQWLIGKPGAVVIVHTDSSVTGNEATCSAAAFATSCDGRVSWRNGVAECSGAKTTLCSEWSSRREVLGELRPIDELNCGPGAACSEPKAPTQLCRTEGGALRCSPR